MKYWQPAYTYTLQCLHFHFPLQDAMGGQKCLFQNFIRPLLVEIVKSQLSIQIPTWMEGSADFWEFHIPYSIYISCWTLRVHFILRIAYAFYIAYFTCIFLAGESISAGPAQFNMSRDFSTGKLTDIAEQFRKQSDERVLSKVNIYTHTHTHTHYIHVCM